MQYAEEFIPLGAQTFSKSKTQYPHGVSPYFIERGLGSKVWDIDGNEYIVRPEGIFRRELNDGLNIATTTPIGSIRSGDVLAKDGTVYGVAIGPCRNHLSTRFDIIAVALSIGGDTICTRDGHEDRLYIGTGFAADFTLNATL